MMSQLPADSIPVSDAELARLIQRIEEQVNYANAILDHQERFKPFGIVIKGTRDGLLDLAAKAMKGAVGAAADAANGTVPAPQATSETASQQRIFRTEVRIVRDDDLRRRLEERAIKPPETDPPWYISVPLTCAFFLFPLSIAVGLFTIVRWLVHFITG